MLALVGQTVSSALPARAFLSQASEGTPSPKEAICDGLENGMPIAWRTTRWGFASASVCRRIAGTRRGGGIEPDRHRPEDVMKKIPACGCDNHALLREGEKAVLGT